MKIVHISIYPPKWEKHSKDGWVASYTKNLITNIPYNDKDEVYILCNKIDNKYDDYIEQWIQVIRCFDKKPRFVFQLYKEIKKIDPDVIHIQQELALYGNIVTAYLLQRLIFFLRKFETIITLHGVVDIKKINKSFVRENNANLPTWVVKLAFRVIYSPLCWWSKKIIVHEQSFRNYMISWYRISKDKLIVVPHGIEDLTPISTLDARKELWYWEKKDIILFMGYATWYKGIDLLIEGFELYAKQNPNAFFIIWAGKHPKLHQEESYIKEYQRRQDKAKKLIPTDQYTWKWFINEDDIIKYYSASDVAVYPYTIQMSSSWPMAISIWYNKPLLASDVFTESLDDKELLFERKPSALSQKLENFFANTHTYDTIIEKLRSERLRDKVWKQTYLAYEKIK